MINDTDPRVLDAARSFALAAHGDQMYGARPYSFHLDAVVRLLSPYGIEAQIVGYLHDVVEDTEITVSDIRDHFGQRIAECVDLLTDSPANSRAERKQQTHARLAAVAGPTELALVVKAADRLANVRTCVIDDRRGLHNVYRSEHPAFKRAVYRAGLCEPLWIELDTLLEVSVASQSSTGDT
ncbi:HD domain-containing protein [Accumulibacter sp.]|uniref:HD domain-containing protein n=1 Tax=Accumulibacter sp. TaxID=2053492 RepID=UPI0026115DBE|nr:HD domain-containing protein [Accumulibacter sp.]